MSFPHSSSRSYLFVVVTALAAPLFVGACSTGLKGTGEGEASEGEGEGEGAQGGEGEGAQGGEGEGAVGGEGEGEGAVGGEGEGEGAVGGEGEGEGANAACAAPKSAHLGDNEGDTSNGTTALVGDDVGADAPCLADPTGQEEVWTFTPTGDGELVVTVTPGTAQSDLGFYVRTACADETTNLGDKTAQQACVDRGSTGEAETDKFEVASGVPLTIVVDTFADNQNPATPGAYTLSLAFTATVCGDGHATGQEQCDGSDLNARTCNDAAPATLGTLSCNQNCTFNTSQCVSVCGGARTATVGDTNAGDTTSGTAVLSESCSPQADDSAHEEIWTFTPATTGVAEITMSSNTDQILFVRSTCNDANTELACSDQGGAGDNEIVTFAVTANVPVTIVVKAFQQNDEGPYNLSIANTAVTEVEPNDTPPTTVNAFATGFTGFVSTATDRDCVSVHAEAQQSITATVGDGGDGRCLSFEIDSFVEIFDVDGTTSLGANDDISTGANGTARNTCSQVTTTSPVSAAGTYFVCVSASPTPEPSGATFEYTLAVTVQ